MWTLIVIALVALLWLLQVTLGTDAGNISSLNAKLLSNVTLGFSVLAVVLVLQRLLKHLLLKPGRAGSSATSDLLQAVMTVTLYLIAAMLYLRFGLGQDVSSVLATSAMLSVIVGLALQPTLGHLFAGVSIEIERPLRVGDFVRREELEGQVVSLSWRSVYLRTERGSIIVLPNSEFTSRLLEVIPAEQPFRHQVNFSMASDHPPGQVIRVAMQVLRSDLPGICTTPGSSVVVVGNDAVTGTLRYAARLYTLQFLDRGTMSSAFLERLWYALSREGMAMLTPPSIWWPSAEGSSEVPCLARESGAERPMPSVPVVRGADSELAEAYEYSANTHTPHVGTVMLEQALACVGSGLQQTLAASARTLRYGRFERCDSAAVALVSQGRLSEDRPLDGAQAEAAFLGLMAELERTPNIAGVSRLNQDVYQRLLHEGSLALGPLAGNLCQRIAALTADPCLAYRAFAESISQQEQRAQFLANTPAHPTRTLREGDWLGWAYMFGLESEIKSCRASQGCTLLVWSPGMLRAALSTASHAELAALVQMLREQAPGCETLNVQRLQTWLQGI
jgi:hypothetical protein